MIKWFVIAGVGVGAVLYLRSQQQQQQVTKPTLAQQAGTLLGSAVTAIYSASTTGSKDGT